MDGNIILAIIAFAAVISPMFTAWINNHYLLKMKQMDHDDELRKQTIFHKRQILENALSAIGAYGVRPENFDKCGSDALLSVAYVDDAVSKELISIVDRMHDREAVEANDLTDISMNLKKAISKLDA